MSIEAMLKAISTYGLAIVGFVILFAMMLKERYDSLKKINDNVTEIAKAQKTQNSFLKMIARKLGIEVFDE